MSELVSGQSYTYTDTPSQPGSYTHSWAFSDGGTATGNPVSHTWSSVGLATATATVTDTVNGIVRVGTRTDYVPGIQNGSANMAVARVLPSVIQMKDGRILISGGYTTGASSVASCEIFNPATGTFSNTGSMSQAKAHHRLTNLPDGRVIAIGGATGSIVYDGSGFAGSPVFLSTLAVTTVEVFNPSTGTWSTLASMPYKRGAHRQFMGSNGKIVVAGGYEPQSTNTWEVYDISLNSWVSGGLPALGFDPTDRYGNTLNLLGCYDIGYHWDSMDTKTVSLAGRPNRTISGQVLAKGWSNTLFSNPIYALDDTGITAAFALPTDAESFAQVNSSSPHYDPPVSWGEYTGSVPPSVDKRRYAATGSFKGWDGNIYYIGGRIQADVVRRTNIGSTYTETSSVPWVDMWMYNNVQPTGLGTRLKPGQVLIHSIDRKKFYLIGGGLTSSTFQSGVYGFNIQTGEALPVINPTTPRHLPGVAKMSDGRWFICGGYLNASTFATSYAYALF